MARGVRPGSMSQPDSRSRGMTLNASYAVQADLSEAASVIAAMRQLHESAELRDEAVANLPAVLDRLGLTGVARQAVAAMVVSGFWWPPRTSVFWA